MRGANTAFAAKLVYFRLKDLAARSAPSGGVHSAERHVMFRQEFCHENKASVLYAIESAFSCSP